MSRTATYPLILLLALICLLSITTTVKADNSIIAGEDEDGDYTNLPEEDLDSDHKDVKGSRLLSTDPSASKKQHIIDVDAPTKDETGPETLVPTDKFSKTNHEVALHSSAKLDISTSASNKFRCGRICFCSGRYFTRCYRYSSKIWYGRYRATRGYCSGKPYFSGNRICIRPYCCACITYLRA